MEDKKLKPCPHCGGAAYLNANFSYKIKRYFVFAKCDICGATGKAITSIEDPAVSEWENTACITASEAWNMRIYEK